MSLLIVDSQTGHRINKLGEQEILGEGTPEDLQNIGRLSFYGSNVNEISPSMVNDQCSAGAAQFTPSTAQRRDNWPASRSVPLSLTAMPDLLSTRPD